MSSSILDSKRKLDDLGSDDDDDVVFPSLAMSRFRKEDIIIINNHNNNTTTTSPLLPVSKLQFFVRMMSGGTTLVMQASPDDTVLSIHQRIHLIKGIPISEQRLIYRGKQLQSELTLSQSSIQNDVVLNLVGRMRSTAHPQGWQLINDMLSLIYSLCRGHKVNDDASKSLKGYISNYLTNTPKDDPDKASSYFNIFTSSSAPHVFVMLYLSPFPGNKDLALSSVSHFLTTSLSTLFFHPYSAPIVLEFCNLLRNLGTHDSLYLSCRNAFGSLLDTCSLSYSLTPPPSPSHGFILIQHVFPFVHELSHSLLTDLDLSLHNPNAAVLVNNVADFAAFLVPLKFGIEEYRRRKGLFSDDDKCHRDLELVQEMEYLYSMYVELLEKMDKCLGKVDQTSGHLDQEKTEGDAPYSACSKYLSILKELYQISKLYDGAEGKFWTVLMRQRKALGLLIVRYAKRTDEHRWILERKCVTNFESRRHLAMLMFPEVKEDYDELHEMLIDRSELLTESFRYIAKAEPESLHAGLFMEFKNEEATGPGVLREWFFLVCQAIFNPQIAFFVACPNNRRRFYPNPASKVHPQHLDYFKFSGRVIALALMHRVQVGIVFDRVFFLQLAGQNITLEDIRDADPYLYSSWKQILDMDADIIDSDALGLTFVREVEELGQRKVVELCPGGESLVVNSKNREKYIDLLIRDHFVISISQQVSHFAKGFSDILSKSNLRQLFFQSLELEDLDWMLQGSEDTISVEDWKAHTEYSGYQETDCQISWFWEIVGRMTAEQRKVLLFFWTSVKYLPVEGFGGLASRLYIYRLREPYDRLPSSHTCFYRLCFPAYPSKAVMQDRLGVITQEHIGSSFGTW